MSASRIDLVGARALLVSIPPDGNGEPVLARFSEAIARAPGLSWIGYLSTVGVYGDHGGNWVDETSAAQSGQRPLAPAACEARKPGSPSGAGPARRSRSFASPASMVPGATRSRTSPTAPRAGSSSRARSSTASTSTTSRRPFSRRSRKSAPGAIYNVADDEPAPAAGCRGLCSGTCRDRAAAGNTVRQGEFEPDGERASTARTSVSRTASSGMSSASP